MNTRNYRTNSLPVLNFRAMPYNMTSKFPKISKFTVVGLYGARTVEIPIKDNKLVLVGENGTGKTTIVNLFYYFLSQQWKRFIGIDFESITMKVSGKNLTLRKDEIIQHLEFKRGRSRGGRGLPIQYKKRMANEFSIEELEVIAGLSVEEIAEDFVHRIGIKSRSPSAARDLKISASAELDLLPTDNKNFSEVNEFLREKVSSQIIYLPTYRRIEKELSSLIPDLDDRIREYQSSTPKRGGGGEYLELVEFGMEDVVQLMNIKRQSSLETATTQFETLAGEFLHDVINENTSTFPIKRIASLEDSYISNVLNRVDEKTLAADDKEKVRDFVKAVKETSSLGQENAQIGYLFSKILDAVEIIETEEFEVTQLANVCNKYFKNKRLIYDRNKYDLTVRRNDTTEIKLRDLSSGEKQILSLFTHLILGIQSNFILIIDEPELSLSVSWQTHFLTDILSLNKCDFMVAVTHSPFIFQNDLDPHAIDLEELYS